MLRRFYLLTLPLVLMGTATFGQVTLVHKFTEGESYKVKTTVKADQKLTIAGQDGGTTSNTSLELKMSAGKRDADGKLPLTMETNILSSEIGLPMGIKIKYDSKNPDAKDEGGNEVTDLIREKIKASAKMSTTIILGKDNQVLEVQGIKPGSDVNPDDIKEEFAEQAKTFPNKPLKKGDTWEREAKVNLGSGQFFTVKRKYTYEGETTKSTVNSTRKVHKITAVDSDAKFSIKEGGALPFKVTKSELKVDESKNTILFDLEAGRSIESNSNLRVSGKIGLSFNNMPIDGDLDLTMKSQVEEVN